MSKRKEEERKMSKEGHLSLPFFCRGTLCATSQQLCRSTLVLPLEMVPSIFIVLEYYLPGLTLSLASVPSEISNE